MVTNERYSAHMTGFTKLWSSIIHSTIWQQELHTKVVWITMLAMSDRHGHVDASIPGLAKAAGVSLRECQDALATLLAPDPFSRTPDYEGRRIVEEPGGWLILNYAASRKRIDEDAKRMATAERVRRYRAKKAATVTEKRTVTHGNNEGVKSNAIADAESEADAYTEEEPPLTPPAGGESAPKKKVSPYTEEFEVYFWRPYPRKIGKRKAFSAYGKAKKRPEWPGCDRLRDSVIEHTASEQWQKDGGQYIPLPETYLNQSRWEDEVMPARSRVPDADVGKHMPPQWGYSDEDREKYRTHQQWEPYLDECAERFGWGGEMGEWPGFEEWLAEHGENE